MADQAWKKLERKVAESFSLWLSGGECKRVLARQKMQGRMVERIGGDLGFHPDCPSEWRSRAATFMDRVIVDAKRRKDFRLELLLFRRRDPMLSWWYKLWGQACETKKWPLLILRQGRNIVACMDSRMLDFHRHQTSEPYFLLSYSINEGYSIATMSFQAFLNRFSPDSIGDWPFYRYHCFLT